jgi:hypothetical protein
MKQFDTKEEAIKFRDELIKKGPDWLCPLSMASPRIKLCEKSCYCYVEPRYFCSDQYNSKLRKNEYRFKVQFGCCDNGMFQGE